MPLDFSDDVAIWIGPEAEFSEQVEYFAPSSAETGKTIWALLLEEFEVEVDGPRGRYRTAGREVRVINDPADGIEAPARNDKIRGGGVDYVVVEVNGPHEGMHWLRCRRAANQRRGEPADKRNI